MRRFEWRRSSLVDSPSRPDTGGGAAAWLTVLSIPRIPPQRPAARRGRLTTPSRWASARGSLRLHDCDSLGSAATTVKARCGHRRTSPRCASLVRSSGVVVDRHHVVIGHDQAVGGQDDARTCSLARPYRSAVAPRLERPGRRPARLVAERPATGWGAAAAVIATVPLECAAPAPPSATPPPPSLFDRHTWSLVMISPGMVRDHDCLTGVPAVGCL